MTKLMARASDSVRAALIDIATANGGYLKPDAVVSAAEDPSSPLHEKFDWDDTEAARKYRNIQAGVLIRMIKITVVKPSPGPSSVSITTTREFQSLPSDREKGGQGYSHVADIMQDVGKRSELLDQVLRELGAYRKRYAELTELSKVWAAFDAIE